MLRIPTFIIEDPLLLGQLGSAVDSLTSVETLPSPSPPASVPKEWDFFSKVNNCPDPNSQTWIPSRIIQDVSLVRSYGQRESAPKMFTSGHVYPDHGVGSSFEGVRRAIFATMAKKALDSRQDARMQRFLRLVQLIVIVWVIEISSIIDSWGEYTTKRWLPLTINDCLLFRSQLKRGENLLFLSFLSSSQVASPGSIASTSEHLFRVSTRTLVDGGNVATLVHLHQSLKISWQGWVK